MLFNQGEFNQAILDNQVVGIFDKPIELKSGRMSHWYVNWRKAMAQVITAVQVARFVVTFVKDLEFEPDCFYGVPEGATKLGILTNVDWFMEGHNDEQPLPMGRARPKDHGAPEDKYFVGAPSGDVIVLEDVTTTCGSLITTLDTLRELDNVNILAAIGLTNRMERRPDGKSVQEVVEKECRVPYYHMSSALDLLPRVLKEDVVKKEVADFIVKEFAEVGLEPLEL